MLLRIALFVVLAIGILGSGAVAWMLLAGPAAVSVAALPPVRVVVLVASRPLQAGALIKAEDLVAQEIAVADMPAGAGLDTPQARGNLTGAMIRRSLGKGQTILPLDVIRPGDHGFLAAVLAPNMRAITVAVDAISGTAGLIWPGDRVDLILTQALDDPALAAGRRVAAETILSDARVIAVDQQIVEGQAPDGTVAPANRTATLEVTAAQAERVLVAGRLGRLSLSVLSADRHADVVLAASSNTASARPAALAITVPPDSSATIDERADKSGITWAGDVSPALNGGARSTPVMVHVFQGTSDSKEFHF